MKPTFTLVLLLVCIFATQNAFAQNAQAPRFAGRVVFENRIQQEEAQVQEGDEKAGIEQQETDNEPAVETTTLVQPQSQKDMPGEREIRLTLWDGTIVTGDINIDFLRIETEFGKLEVPVKNIIRLQPGLDSFPELNAKLKTLVEQLGDRNFQTRENAHRELVTLGPSVRSELDRFEDGGSAERRKHLEKIKEEIDEVLAEQDDWEGEGESVQELVRGDTIQTPDFTIVGRILQPEFTLSSKYGELNINLSDIKSGDRTWMQTTEQITKSVAVKGNAFFQTTPTSTKIRVSKGDRIKIKASGNVSWAAWGNISSGPGGITNQGNWQQFNCGTLVARIGNGNDYEKIGDKNEFVAKTSGVLYLGIAMRDNYARQASYTWPGEYKARISVTPASEKLP